MDDLSQACGKAESLRGSLRRSVDISLQLNIWITPPCSDVQIASCHNVPYIFDIGAILRLGSFNCMKN